ncbi:MAG: PKD domain-containing protein, partial [Planctomycetes bacterium]|nr:PKD domain-containing protein [Planctomycetota bacterium]
APNRSPEARVTPTTLQAKVGEPVELDASNSSDPDGEVVSYTWRVGNGTPMTSKVPTFHHTFREPGLQTILLTVEDDRGATAVYVVQAVVKE